MTIGLSTNQWQGTLQSRADRPSKSAAVEPMANMNTTPLIDVMLVLLIMLIITIPPQSHSVKWDQGGDPPRLSLNPDPVKNEIIVDAGGAFRWNGVAMTDRQIRALLAATATMEPRPELHLRPDATARYDRVDQLMAMVKQSGVEAFGFVGNGQYQESF